MSRSTTDFDYDLVAIGSGPAGQRAAVQAAKLGQRAAVIERSRCVGGICIDTGTIPSKTLREAVLRSVKVNDAPERNPLVRARTPYTAPELLAGVEAVMAREIEVVERQLERNDVAFVAGEASFVDPHTLAVRGGQNGDRLVRARNIVIAVGTRPAATPGVQSDGEVVFDSDQILRMKTLPRTLAVVGAG